MIATNGGVLTLTDTDITTTGANGAPLATDRGSGTATAGPAFFVTKTKAVIALAGTTISSVSDTLIGAAATDRWGSTGKNGGVVSFTADNENLSGNMITDSISSISAVLNDGITLTGTIRTASLSLDATSTWIVTGNSALAGVTDAGGISGTTITNIYGNGYTVTYDSSLAANSALGGKTYTLKGGGVLTPK